MKPVRKLRTEYLDSVLNDTPHQTQEGVIQFLPFLEESYKSAEAAEGCASATVNMRISAANGYLAFVGRRDLQLLNQLEKKQAEVPELTRTEYLRLLQTARALGNGTGYFIIKLFGDTGIRPQDLPKVTVEAVKTGEIDLGEGVSLRLPDCLCEELLVFAKQQGKAAGPLIAQRDGRPMARTQVNKQIERLCHDAQVSEEKASPKVLRQLYRQTYGEIEQNIAILIRQAYDHLLEAEQASIGWGQK